MLAKTRAQLKSQVAKLPALAHAQRELHHKQAQLVHLKDTQQEEEAARQSKMRAGSPSKVRAPLCAGADESGGGKPGRKSIDLCCMLGNIV